MEQYVLAIDYRLGHNVKKDKSKGIKWLKIAADNWNSSADIELAMLYLRGGLGLSQNNQLFNKYI